jgi:hypothetical protein
MIAGSKMTVSKFVSSRAFSLTLLAAWFVAIVLIIVAVRDKRARVAAERTKLQGVCEAYRAAVTTEARVRVDAELRARLDERAQDPVRVAAAEACAP